jgi:class 3 adenylate cyclase
MTPFRTWLAENGLGRYDAVFVSNEIDFDVIRSLTDADLRELGLALGDRKRLLQAVGRLNGELAVGAVAPVAPSGDAVSPGGERRQLTVMFCDLVGSTALVKSSTPKNCEACCTRIAPSVAM